MFRISTLVIKLALVIVLLASCVSSAPSTSSTGAETGSDAAAGTPKLGGTLTVALDGEIDTIDPHKSVTIVAFQVQQSIFESLVQSTPTLDGVEPELAESWEQVDDVT